MTIIQRTRTRKFTILLCILIVHSGHWILCKLYRGIKEEGAQNNTKIAHLLILFYSDGVLTGIRIIIIIVIPNSSHNACYGILNSSLFNNKSWMDEFGFFLESRNQHEKLYFLRWLLIEVSVFIPLNINLTWIVSRIATETKEFLYLPYHGH